MKTVNSTVLLILIPILPLIAQVNKGGSTKTPIIAGENIAVVQTASGKVRGYVHEDIFIYKGIPYAKAERFMLPAKTDTWEGVRSSMAWGPTCPMMTPPTVGSDEAEFIFQHDWGYFGEDCLRLNIWTPGINDGKKRPVMVWIHGGGYTFGSSQELPSYDGESLSKKGDVVYISVNHRLKMVNFYPINLLMPGHWPFLMMFHL